MNRELLKQAIKKLVLQEMTQADYGVGKPSTNDTLVKDVKKSVGKAGEASENPLNGKVTVDDGEGGKKYQCEIVECGEGLFDATVITHGSDRKVGKALTADKLAEFLKTSVKTEKSAVEKAREKSINSGPEKKEPKKEEKVADEMEDAEEETQVDIADDNDVKADVKVDKKLAPVNKDVSASMGGSIVDKIEKIVDRILKDKAEAKSAHLKTDSKMESPDKLTVKVKDTPALKEKKS